MDKQPSISHFKAPAVLLGVLLLSSGLSCAVAPEPVAESAPEPQAEAASPAETAMSDAYGNYQRRDFAAAAAGFNALLEDDGTAANDRVMANLGKALVHLSTDTEWRDLSQAGAALQAAEALAGDSSDAGTGMLMNALSSLIGVENNISELNTKLSNSTSEIAGLKGDLETAAAEQTALNEALEKLKAITIGN